MGTVVTYATLDRVVLPRLNGQKSHGPGLEVGNILPADSRLVASRAKLTVVLIVSERCSFCVQSVPFYRRLVDLRRHAPSSAVRVLFLGASAGADADRFVSQFGFDREETAPLPPDLSTRVRGTPTLVLLGADGRISGAWEGRLSESQEQVVLGKVGAVLQQMSEGLGP